MIMERTTISFLGRYDPKGKKAVFYEKFNGRGGTIKSSIKEVGRCPATYEGIRSWLMDYPRGKTLQEALGLPTQEVLAAYLFGLIYQDRDTLTNLDFQDNYRRERQRLEVQIGKSLGTLSTALEELRRRGLIF